MRPGPEELAARMRRGAELLYLTSDGPILWSKASRQDLAELLTAAADALTAPTDRAEVERLRLLLDDAMRTVATLVAKQGGTVDLTDHDLAHDYQLDASAHPTEPGVTRLTARRQGRG